MEKCFSVVTVDIDGTMTDTPYIPNKEYLEWSTEKSHEFYRGVPPRVRTKNAPELEIRQYLNKLRSVSDAVYLVTARSFPGAARITTDWINYFGLRYLIEGIIVGATNEDNFARRKEVLKGLQSEVHFDDRKDFIELCSNDPDFSGVKFFHVGGKNNPYMIDAVDYLLFNVHHNYI